MRDLALWWIANGRHEVLGQVVKVRAALADRAREPGIHVQHVEDLALAACVAPSRPLDEAAAQRDVRLRKLAPGGKGPEEHAAAQMADGVALHALGPARAKDVRCPRTQVAHQDGRVEHVGQQTRLALASDALARRAQPDVERPEAGAELGDEMRRRCSPSAKRAAQRQIDVLVHGTAEEGQGNACLVTAPEARNGHLGRMLGALTGALAGAFPRKKATHGRLDDEEDAGPLALADVLAPCALDDDRRETRLGGLAVVEKELLLPVQVAVQQGR